MKKSTLYAKKTLSVFMAVLMLMSAWVFVAPAEAEAVMDNSSKAADKYGTPYWVASDSNTRWMRWGSAADSSNDHLYIKVPKTIYMDVSESLQSAGYVITYSWHFGDSTDYRMGISSPVWGENSSYTGQNSTYFYTMTNAFSGFTVDSSKHGSAVYGENTTNTNNYDMRVFDNYDGYKNIVYKNLNGTLYTGTLYFKGTPKGTYSGRYSTYGSNPSYFGFGQKWGTSWKQHDNYTNMMKAKPTAASEQHDGWNEVFWDVEIYNKAALNSTVTDAAKIVKQGSNYLYTDASFNALQTAISNGRAKLTTREVTQSQLDNAENAIYTAIAGLTEVKYSVKFINIAGTTVYSKTDYSYNDAVNLIAIADSLANSIEQIEGNANQHQTYTWNTGSNTINITSDVTIYETASSKVSHNFPEDFTPDETTHSRTCNDCGYVWSQEHNSNTVKTTPATCSAPGEIIKSCNVCGKVMSTETINKLPHTFSGEYTIKDGKHYQNCSVCGASSDGEAHVSDEGTVTIAPGCLTAGEMTYKCEICDAELGTAPISATGHKNVTKTEAVDVSDVCGGKGNMEFYTCADCGKVYKSYNAETFAGSDEVTDLTDTDGNNIPDVLETDGPAHVFTSGEYKKGTNGKHTQKCVNCNVYGAEEDHNYGDPVVTPASCTAPGKEVYTCTKCDYEHKETIDKAPHTLSKIEAVAAECNKAGNNEYYQCDVCKDYFKDAEGKIATTAEAEAIDALVHTWTAHHDYDTENTPATCQTKAVYNNHCDYCKVKLYGSTHSYGEVDKVNGHKFNGEIQKNADGTHSYKCTVAGCQEYGNATDCNYKETANVASTCKTFGYITYTCETCENGYTNKKTELASDNHEGGTEVRDALAAMCNENGYTGDTYCLGCDKKIADGETIEADPSVHTHVDMKVYEKLEATCQTEGYEAYEYCSACDTYKVEKVVIGKKAHKFTNYISNNNGTHTATCDTCDASVKTPATDTQNCYGGAANCVDKKVCTACKTAYGEVDSATHKTVKTKLTQAPTCQTEGCEPYRYCEACGTDIDVKIPIEKKDHIYGAWSKVEGSDQHTRSCITCDAEVAPVATETQACTGGTAYCNALAKCSVCKAEYGVKDSANHKSTVTTRKGEEAATCQSEGYTGDLHYNCCDAVKESGSATAKLDHKFDDEVTRTPATCIAVGSVTKKCSTCVESEGVTAATNTEELPIDLKNHASKEVKVVGKKAATCEEDGYTGDEYHACCYKENASDSENSKALISKGTVIKANGQHIYGDIIPEYMIAETTTDENGKETIVLKTAEPTYDEKVEARHENGKWYHAKVCTICDAIVYEACYTYAHTYSCKKTDICEVCEGLCSLIDENKHDLDVVRGKEASESEEGVKDYYQCKDCAECFLDEVGTKSFDPTTDEGKALLVIPVITASCNWDTEYTVTEPTCVKDGKKVYKCEDKDCDKTKVVVIPATGKHTWDSEYTVTDEPTCGKNGYKAIKCTGCDAIKSGSYEVIPATGEHAYDTNGDGIFDEDDAVERTNGTSCSDPAILTYKCKACGDTYTVESTTGVSAHKWGEWVAKGGDCSTGVVQVRTCSECQLQEREVKTTVDHEFAIKVKVEPNCENEGYIDRVCKNCGIIEREILPATSETEGHLINTEHYKTISKATCESAEKRQYTCTLCNEKVVMHYGSPLEHVWLYQSAEVATCERDGHGEYYRCVRCEKAEVEPEIYKATGHVDADNDDLCDNCEGLFYKDGSEPCTCMCHNDGILSKFIFKVICFFWRLFKINPSCACGNVHY